MGATRKTRGPRTPEERATDAVRTAATLFEKLPPSRTADELLKPLAVLLRFWIAPYDPSRTTLSQVRHFEELERRFLDLDATIESMLDHIPVPEAFHIGGLFENVRRDLQHEKARIAAAANGGECGQR